MQTLINSKAKLGTSLVVQWLRICLAMEEIQVWSLVRELRSRMQWSYCALALLSLCATTKESMHHTETSSMAKILSAATKIQYSQINIFKCFKKIKKNQITWFSNRQRTWIEFFPEKTYQLPKKYMKMCSTSVIIW